MICFFCATPYHIMVCLNMALYQFKNKKKCLVIFNHFKNYSFVSKICEQTGVFVRVVVVETNNLGAIENWNRRYHTFFLYRSLDRLCNNYVFEKLIFFVIDPLNVSFVIKKVLAKNSGCEMCLAEDGLGSYISHDIYQPKEKVLFWLRFLGRIQYYEKLSYIFLLHPEFLTNKPNYEVRKISQKGFVVPEFKKIISQLFNCQKMPECDFILLQQPLVQDRNDLKTVSESQDSLFKLIDAKMKNKRAYIKIHPRTKSFVQLKNIKELDQISPFETMIDEKINRSTIVTVYSTAAFTPYMLFGFKPRIILLLRLCGNFVFAADMARFLSVFVKHYKEEGGEIFVPETLGELDRLLV